MTFYKYLCRMSVTLMLFQNCEGMEWSQQASLSEDREFNENFLNIGDDYYTEKYWNTFSNVKLFDITAQWNTNNYILAFTALGDAKKKEVPVAVVTKDVETGNSMLWRGNMYQPDSLIAEPLPLPAMFASTTVFDGNRLAYKSSYPHILVQTELGTGSYYSTELPINLEAYRSGLGHLSLSVQCGLMGLSCGGGSERRGGKSFFIDPKKSESVVEFNLPNVLFKATSSDGRVVLAGNRHHLIFCALDRDKAWDFSAETILKERAATFVFRSTPIILENYQTLINVNQGVYCLEHEKSYLNQLSKSPARDIAACGFFCAGLFQERKSSKICVYDVDSHEEVLNLPLDFEASGIKFLPDLSGFLVKQEKTSYSINGEITLSNSALSLLKLAQPLIRKSNVDYGEAFVRDVICRGLNCD